MWWDKCDFEGIAQHYGTPCYVYSRQKIEENWRAFSEPFKAQKQAHHICYAVKANSNLAVLNILARLGSGFDIVSGGELARVLKAGGDPAKIVFSGVGKQDHEIIAALNHNIGCFNVESKFELGQINQLAKSLHKIASVSLRINPDIPVQSHPYISTGLKDNKFGIPFEQAIFLYQYAKSLPHVAIKGIACHLGSQIDDPEPYLIAFRKLIKLIDELAKKNIIISQCDIGGGFSICYGMEEKEKKFDFNYFISKIMPELKNRKLTLLLEPGRGIVGEAGVLLTRVISVKDQGNAKNFAIVDAAMNDLIRPALYQAYHEIIKVNNNKNKHTHTEKYYDIVGPVCETGDFLGHHRLLNLDNNDLVLIVNSGAYGFVMSSNYNSRPRCAEVMINHDNTPCLIRARETLDDLWMNESCLP